MLFSSYAFLFGFLPAAWLATWLCDRRWGVRGGTLAVVLASLAFYAAWDARFLLLLGGSMAGNFVAGRRIAAAGRGRAGAVLAVAIAANLGLLGWFKYAGFFATNLNAVLGAGLPVPVPLLPLGISFFTFEQIGYLVDVHRGERRRDRHPPLCAVRQLFPAPGGRADPAAPRDHAADPAGRADADRRDRPGGRPDAVQHRPVQEDGAGRWHRPLRRAGVRRCRSADLPTAWGGALAYTMQIYFDFSGYSDMAIGLARMFGIRFPGNFDSPYKAGSIIEFWRRWHMTLSRFLRDYLYIPLGGNRRGPVRRYVNLMITMLLGGLWHGANWTFVAWGLLHGAALIVAHAGAGLRARWPAAVLPSGRLGRLAGWALTMAVVVVAWVVFRAPSFTVAWHVLGGMAGANGIALPAGIVDAVPGLQPWMQALGIGRSDASGSQMVLTWAWVLALGGVASLLPNTQTVLRAWHPVLETTAAPAAPLWWQWRPSRAWAVAMGAVALGGVLAIDRGGEFLYWQF